MTVMFLDVKQKMASNILQYRVQGARFDEILFADDTICISHDTKTMNKMLKAIMEVGLLSGMKLNYNKCEAIRFGTPARVHFGDGTPVKEVATAKYLGCHLNKTNDTTRETKGRI